jgi:hypothetical protein
LKVARDLQAVLQVLLTGLNEDNPTLLIPTTPSTALMSWGPKVLQPPPQLTAFEFSQLLCESSYRHLRRVSCEITQSYCNQILPSRATSQDTSFSGNREKRLCSKVEHLEHFIRDGQNGEGPLRTCLHTPLSLEGHFAQCCLLSPSDPGSCSWLWTSGGRCPPSVQNKDHVVKKYRTPRQQWEAEQKGLRMQRQQA